MAGEGKGDEPPPQLKFMVMPLALRILPRPSVSLYVRPPVCPVWTVKWRTKYVISYQYVSFQLKTSKVGVSGGRTVQCVWKS